MKLCSGKIIVKQYSSGRDLLHFQMIKTALKIVIAEKLTLNVRHTSLICVPCRMLIQVNSSCENFQIPTPHHCSIQALNELVRNFMLCRYTQMDFRIVHFIWYVYDLFSILCACITYICSVYFLGLFIHVFIM